MLKTSPISIGFYLITVFFFLLYNPAISSGRDDFSLGPLLNIEEDESQESQEVDLLGPFITSKRDKDSSEFGLRPLFYLLRDSEKDSTEFDFLYPIATYDRREEDWDFQFLIYLLSYESEKKPSGFRETEFTLFPFIFSKRAEDRDKSYFAVFPLYGGLKDKFARDEINFLLFPLYLETKKGGFTNYSFLWPIFGYYTGGGQEGFRLWPLFGYRKRGETLDEKFALWPIYVSKRWEFFGEERRSFMIFPFYSTLESPERTQSTYLWPLFNRLVDREKEIERWDTPWPLINFTRGKKTGNRVFPFYASEEDKNSEEGFFLWPLYRYSNLTLEDHVRKRKTFLLFLYSDIKEEPTIDGGREGRRIDFWPLFSYKRDEKGNRSFHFLSLLEPFFSNNKGIERNYAPLWRLFEWNKYEDGRSVSSFLWNTYRMEKSKDMTKVDLRPIIPIFSYVDSEEKSKFYFLGGLFGYKSDQRKKTFKLFFIPINISKDETKEEEGGSKNE